VPAVDGEGELLSDRMLSSISPPLPEFTVIWGGLRDLRESSESTVRESMAMVVVCPDQGINKPLASALLLGVQGVGVEIDLKNRTGGGGRTRGISMAQITFVLSTVASLSDLSRALVFVQRIVNSEGRLGEQGTTRRMSESVRQDTREKECDNGKIGRR